jgi:hypothetical protein
MQHNNKLIFFVHRIFRAVHNNTQLDNLSACRESNQRRIEYRTDITQPRRSFNIVFCIVQYYWPRGLVRGSAAAHQLGLQVRILPGTWMFVCCECHVCCQVVVSAPGWSPVQRSPTDCGVSECDRETSVMKRPWPTRGCCVTEKKYNILSLRLGKKLASKDA